MQMLRRMAATVAVDEAFHTGPYLFTLRDDDRR